MYHVSYNCNLQWMKLLKLKFTKLLKLKFTSMRHSFQTNVTLLCQGVTHGELLRLSCLFWCPSQCTRRPPRCCWLLKLSYTHWRTAFNCMYTLFFWHCGFQVFSMHIMDTMITLIITWLNTFTHQGEKFVAQVFVKGICKQVFWKWTYNICQFREWLFTSRESPLIENGPNFSLTCNFWWSLHQQIRYMYRYTIKKQLLLMF